MDELVARTGESFWPAFFLRYELDKRVNKRHSKREVVDLDSFKKFIRSAIKCMATDEMVASGLKEPHFRRLMQEWRVSTLAKLEDIWNQDTGHTLTGDVAKKTRTTGETNPRLD